MPGIASGFEKSAPESLLPLKCSQYKKLLNCSTKSFSSANINLLHFIKAKLQADREYTNQCTCNEFISTFLSWTPGIQAKYTDGKNPRFVLTNQRIVLVHPALRFTQLCHTAQPCLAGEETWSSSAAVLLLLTGLPPHSVTGQWNEKQHIDKLVCHSAHSSYQHAPWTAKHFDLILELFFPFWPLL